MPWVIFSFIVLPSLSPSPVLIRFRVLFMLVSALSVAVVAVVLGSQSFGSKWS